MLKQSAPAFPADAELFYMLGLAQSETRLGRDDCRESLNKALKLNPDSPYAAKAKTVLEALK